MNKLLKISTILALFCIMNNSYAQTYWKFGGNTPTNSNDYFGTSNNKDVNVKTNSSPIFDFTTNGDIDYKNSIRGIMHLGRYSFVLPAPVGGTVLKNIRINERGQGQMTVYAENLSAGMYTYSLVADGNIVATKKMICEKK
jgi:hypothetical protein